MAGQRSVTVDEYLGSKKLHLLNYETSLYRHGKYDGFGYNYFGEMEFDLLKLLYLIKRNISPETVGFTLKMLKNMPLIVERGMIKMNEGKPELLIPCLTHEQYDLFRRICRSAADEAAVLLKDPVGEYIKARKKTIPPHLKSVPDQKLTMPYGPSPMTFVYQAVYKGIIKRDLGYPCPETVVVID